jgi:hypothetical protein
MPAQWSWFMTGLFPARMIERGGQGLDSERPIRRPS